MTLLWVCVAGALGVASRYGISSAFHGDALPWATFAINVAGCFLLGMLTVNHSIGVQGRTIAGVGFLGGFTSYSTFGVQAWLDLEAGEPGRALAYVGASVVVGIAAAAAGYYVGRAVW
jgi:CrcB protein